MELVIEKVNADTMQSPGQMLAALDQHCEQHQSVNEADGVRVASIDPYTTSAQGDVNFTRLPWLPELAAGVIDAQLAPGHSRGSRHVILHDHMEHTQFYRRGEVGGSSANRDILGPVIFCTKDTIVTHPEHKWMLLAAGAWGVTYQQAMQGDRVGRAID
jgi:hypothetical protein